MTSNQTTPNFKSAPLWIAGMFFFAWYFLYVDGLWGYAQHLIIKKKVVPSSLFVAVMFFFIIKERARGALRTSSHIPPIIYSWACWMLLVLLIDSQMTFSSPIRVAFGFYVNYWHFFLAALIVNTSFKLDPKQTLYIFLISAAPVICLGVAQGIKQDNFSIGRWISEEASAFNLGFYGKRRANGAFAHAEDLGCYSTMVICMCLALFIQTQKMLTKFFLAGVICVSAAALYFTLTRVTYLIGICGIIATILITYAHKSRSKNTTYLYWLPLAFFIIGVAIYFSAPLISLLSKSSTLLSSASLADRLYGNKYYLTELARNGWYSIFTGLGWFINGHYKATVALDNQYIALILSTGIIGLLFWLALTISLWKILLTRTLSSGSPILIGLTATASAWLTQSVFNVANTFAFLAILGLTINHQKQEDEAKS